jgi:hypothetical protein
MKDLRLSSAHQCDRDGLKVTNNKMSHSIVNSVTNDEDDWLDSRKNSGNSIMNSVTNDEDSLLDTRKNSGHSIMNSVTNDEDEDEDEWIEHRNNSRGVAVSVQHRPRNYQSAFSKQETAIKGLKQTKSTIPSNPSLSIFERERFAKNHFDKESFLIRYEHMMKEQQKEQISTISHLQFFLELLIDLQLDGKDGVYRHQRFDENEGNCLLIEFSIEDLKQAQRKLKNSEKYDIVKTDKQFLMVLDILCEDNDNSPKLFSSEKKQKQISWAEIIQCYRYCVVGMQTLEIIGSESSIRKRTKERTLALLSGYRESSFLKYSPSIKVSGTYDTVGSDKTYDRSVVNSSRVDQGTQQDTKSRRLLNHPLVSFFTGAMVVAILFYERSSTIKSMTYYQDTTPLARRTQDVKCPIEVNESSYSTGREFKIFEKTIDAPQDLVHMVPTKGDSNPLKMKSLITTTGHAVPSIARARTSGNDSFSPSTSSKTMVFDPKLVVANEYDDKISAKRPSSFDFKVANVLGSTATILYFLSPPTGSITAVLGWLPAGLGVVMAAFAARSIRDGVSNIWKNLKFNRKKRNTVSS